MSLLISSIAFRRGSTDFVFVNGGSKPTQLTKFMPPLDGLIAAGLTFETVERQIPVGPPLAESDIRNERVLSTLLTAGPGAPLSLSTVNAAPGHHGAHAPTHYQLSRTERWPNPAACSVAKPHTAALRTPRSRVRASSPPPTARMTTPTGRSSCSAN